MVADVVMPRISGPRLAERVRPLRPLMRVLFVSGYADGELHHHGALRPGVAFLPKPVTPDALLRVARELLDAGDGLPPSQ
jgi:FixJ family two-component response regulator